MSNQAEINDYYKKFWNEEFHTDMPNPEERVRAEAVCALIEQSILSGYSQGSKISILDLGCGRGWLTQILSSYGNVLGIDPVEAAVNRAHELFPQLDFRLGDVSTLLSEGLAGHFHLIVSCEVIEHMQDAKKQDFLDAINTLLTDGGFALLSTPRAELYVQWKQVYPDGGQPIEEWISEDHFEKLFCNAGFHLIKRDRLRQPILRCNFESRIATSKSLGHLEGKIPFLKNYLEKHRYRYALHQLVLIQKKKSR